MSFLRLGAVFVVKPIVDRFLMARPMRLIAARQAVRAGYRLAELKGDVVRTGGLNQTTKISTTGFGRNQYAERDRSAKFAALASH